MDDLDTQFACYQMLIQTNMKSAIWCKDLTNQLFMEIPLRYVV